MSNLHPDTRSDCRSGFLIAPSILSADFAREDDIVAISGGAVSQEEAEAEAETEATRTVEPQEEAEAEASR